MKTITIMTTPTGQVIEMCQQIQRVTGIEFEEISEDLPTLEVFPSQLVRVLTVLNNHSALCFQRLIDVIVVDQTEYDRYFRVHYILLSSTYKLCLDICIRLQQSQALPPIDALYPLAYERENAITERLHIPLSGSLKERMDLKGKWMKKLGKALQPENELYNERYSERYNQAQYFVDLTNSKVFSGFEVGAKVCLEGERIRALYLTSKNDSCFSEIFKHGEEVLETYKRYQKFESMASFSRAWSFWKGISKLIAYHTDYAVNIFFALLCECERIVSHLLNLSQIIQYIDIEVSQQDVLSLKRTFLKNTALFLTPSFLNHFFTGEEADQIETFDRAFFKATYDFIQYSLLPEAERLTGLINKILNSFLFRYRTRDEGMISKELAMSYALSGPNARASDLDYDIRTIPARPSSEIYSQVDFCVPHTTDGDVYGRCIIRLEEIIQSFKISKQFISMLRNGYASPKNDGAAFEESHQSFQAPIVISHALYSSSESPHGELGFYLVPNAFFGPQKKLAQKRTTLSLFATEEQNSDVSVLSSKNTRPKKQNYLYQCQANGASLNVFQILPYVCQDVLLSDLGLILLSFDIDPDEIMPMM